MLARVVVENGVKKLVPLTADCGSGNPVGTVIAVYSNKVPNGYLPCNGVAFDTAQFPVLYALLGDNHTPDLRECTLVGIGQSDRAMGAHDVYTIGQFKDDQLQNITGSIKALNDKNWIPPTDYSATGAVSPIDERGAYGGASGSAEEYHTIGFTFDASRVARTGTTTHGKQVGVNWCIKATSGINENQADNVLSALSPVNTVANGDMHSVTSNAVYPIKEKTDKMYVDNQLELVRYLPYLSWQLLPSQSNDDNVYFKEWFDYMYNNHHFDDEYAIFIGQANPNYKVMVWGFTYGGAGAYDWSLFYYMKPDSNLMKFGYRGGVWFCGQA